MLVVATPCRLILAVPVALVSGLSSAAGIGVLVKGGGALEALARMRVLVIDKTGTLTHGQARLSRVRTLPPFTEAEAMRLAASLDQASSHPIARALVAQARERGLTLAPPSEVIEEAGEGLVGLVEDRQVRVGGPRSMQRHGIAFPPDLPPTGAGPEGAAVATVQVAVEDRPAAILDFADPLRTDGGRTLAALRACGIERVVLAIGDRRVVAEALVAGLAVDEVAADLDPSGKTAIVALGTRGAAAAAEAADIVLLVDTLDPLPQAMGMARRVRAIALQSVLAGLGMSLAAMVAAAFGHLTPLQGALLQEAIDVAVVLNAMRALGGAPRPAARDRPPVP